MSSLVSLPTYRPFVLSLVLLLCAGAVSERFEDVSPTSCRLKGLPTADPERFRRLVVIAGTKASVTWGDELVRHGIGYVVYSATPREEQETPPYATLSSPSNVGFEAASYISFIVQNYGCLPDTVAFVHSHRFDDHQKYIRTPIAELARRFTAFNAVTRLTELCWDRIDGLSVHPGYYSLHPVAVRYPTKLLALSQVSNETWPLIGAKLGYPIDPKFPGKLPDKMSFHCCGQFVATRDALKKVGWDFWRAAYDFLLNPPVKKAYYYRFGRMYEHVWDHLIGGPQALQSYRRLQDRVMFSCNAPADPHATQNIPVNRSVVAGSVAPHDVTAQPSPAPPLFCPFTSNDLAGPDPPSTDPRCCRKKLQFGHQPAEVFLVTPVAYSTQHPWWHMAVNDMPNWGVSPMFTTLASKKTISSQYACPHSAGIGAFFQFVAENYDCLPSHIVFLQHKVFGDQERKGFGTPSPHRLKLRKLSPSALWNQQAKAVLETLCIDRLPPGGYYNFANKLDSIQPEGDLRAALESRWDMFVRDAMGLPPSTSLPRQLSFHACSQFVVSRERILSHPLSLYVNLLRDVCSDSKNWRSALVSRSYEVFLDSLFGAGGLETRTDTVLDHNTHSALFACNNTASDDDHD